MRDWGVTKEYSSLLIGHYVLTNQLAGWLVEWLTAWLTARANDDWLTPRNDWDCWALQNRTWTLHLLSYSLWHDANTCFWWRHRGMSSRCVDTQFCRDVTLLRHANSRSKKIITFRISFLSLQSYLKKPDYLWAQNFWINICQLTGGCGIASQSCEISSEYFYMLQRSRILLINSSLKWEVLLHQMWDTALEIVLHDTTFLVVLWIRLLLLPLTKHMASSCQGWHSQQSLFLRPL